MKKIILLSALSVTVLTGLVSCTKCEVCTKESADEVRICQKDYGNNTEYGLAVDMREADGYTCKSSL